MIKSAIFTRPLKINLLISDLTFTLKPAMVYNSRIYLDNENSHALDPT